MSFVKQVFTVRYIGQAKDAVGPPFNCGTQKSRNLLMLPSREF